MEDRSPPSDFAGLRVAAFESRRCDELARLITKHAGVPFVTPSMREVSISENSAINEFTQRLLTGDLEIVIFTTGVGFEFVFREATQRIDPTRFLHFLSDITTVARGPKSVAAMRRRGITPTLTVPAPNTWREILVAIDEHLSVSNQTVVIQEYGESNPSLMAGLEARGAEVFRLPVYRWGLPEDVGPLDENVRALAAGERDVCLFTSAQQWDHVSRRAQALDCQAELVQALSRTVVGSVGPTTSERLREAGVAVDLEPAHAKMGHLTAETAAAANRLLQRKRQVAAALAHPPSVETGEREKRARESLFLRACRGEPTPTTPIWLMRQAGRYLPEYRAIREKTSFLELCKRPELCAEIMINTVNRLGVDAAIIFSDLLPILEPMGMHLEYAAGEGPVIHNPVREAADVDRVVELESAEALSFVMDTVRMTRAGLPNDLPVIGFAGAPFTLASYAIEGGSSRTYLHTKTLMYRDPGAWNELMERLVRSITKYLNAQIQAGADCVQIFDSWAGCLSVDDYRRYVLMHVRHIIERLDPSIPVIYFATGNPALLPSLADAGSQVVGVDWRIRLDDAWKLVGTDRAVQGNLEPLVLMADRETVVARAHDVLKRAGGRPGHIFNLGHGVLPQTPVDNVLALIDAVHEWTPAG